jgi:hypothetical protein
MAKNNEEPKKGKQSDIKQSPMYKVGADRKKTSDIEKANLKGKEYVAEAKSTVKEYKKGKEDLNAMKESIPMSNKTIEYFHKRYQ